MHPSINVSRLASAIQRGSIVSSYYVCLPLSCLLCMISGRPGLSVTVFGQCSVGSLLTASWFTDVHLVGSHPQISKKGQPTECTNEDFTIKISPAISSHLLSQRYFVSREFHILCCCPFHCRVAQWRFSWTRHLHPLERYDEGVLSIFWGLQLIHDKAPKSIIQNKVTISIIDRFRPVFLHQLCSRMCLTWISTWCRSRSYQYLISDRLANLILTILSYLATKPSFTTVSGYTISAYLDTTGIYVIMEWYLKITVSSLTPQI